MMGCPLCAKTGEQLLWQDALCRVILVDDADYPGFCRVILHRHIKEMTDLDEVERLRIMEVVFAVEQTLRKVMQPDKINLASLGNVVPHLHWHVIPRFADDRHFPNPIWGETRRSRFRRALPGDLQRRLAEALPYLLD